MMKIRAQISGNHQSAGSAGTSSSSEQQPELTDDALYAQNKLTLQNKGARVCFPLDANNLLGFQMLQRMGWSSGAGLGREEQGITAPVKELVVFILSRYPCVPGIEHKPVKFIQFLF